VGQRIWLLAGEASGDVLGGRLIGALKAQRPGLQFTGIGGPRMLAAGLGASLFPMADLAVMGLAEVLPRVLALRQRLAQAVADIEAQRPDLVVTIDSPGFTLRLLKRIQPLGIKRVHYVAPQVWAWRQKRVKTYPGLWDELLCLLPFEPEFFARHDLHANFVGHPVLESGAGQGVAERFFATNKILRGATPVVILPGSRVRPAGCCRFFARPWPACNCRSPIWCRFLPRHLALPMLLQAWSPTGRLSRSLSVARPTATTLLPPRRRR
jgi:lipid-A-disaccharide synthase